MARIIGQNTENHVEEGSAPSDSTAVSAAAVNTGLPAHLQDLTDRARGYVEAASSANTRRAYASDWKHFTAWCRRRNLSPLAPDPQVVGLYITACASGSAEHGAKANSVSTIERRLSALTWTCAQRGEKLDRRDRAIAIVMAGIRNSHAAPARQKEAILPEDLIAMLETLGRGTLRDRAMLLLGFAAACAARRLSASTAARPTPPARWLPSKPGSSSQKSPEAPSSAGSKAAAGMSAPTG